MGLKKNQPSIQSWVSGSAVELLTSMLEALGSISTKKERKKERKKKKEVF
jgi:hypothetical protein